MRTESSLLNSNWAFRLISSKIIVFRTIQVFLHCDVGNNFGNWNRATFPTRLIQIARASLSIPNFFSPNACCLFSGIYMLVSMSLVAICICASVLVTKIYTRNTTKVRFWARIARYAHCNVEPKAVTTPEVDAKNERKTKSKEMETEKDSHLREDDDPKETEEYCKKLALKVDKILFYVWLTLNGLCAFVTFTLIFVCWTFCHN